MINYLRVSQLNYMRYGTLLTRSHSRVGQEKFHTQTFPKNPGKIPTAGLDCRCARQYLQGTGVISYKWSNHTATESFMGLDYVTVDDSVLEAWAVAIPSSPPVSWTASHWRRSKSSKKGKKEKKKRNNNKLTTWDAQQRCLSPKV